MSSQPLSIQAPSNFRDLAERVHPQLALRPRTLFRSDHLGGLDEAQARAIQALGVRRVLDFRGATERQSAACAVPGVTVHSLAVEPTIVQVLSDLTAAGRRPTSGEVVEHMRDTYRAFVRHNAPRFSQFFSLLLASGEPTVFHCTAGKDRTGFAAALLLHALGASREAIVDDYLLTNQRLRPPAGAGSWLGPEVAAVLWGVQPAFLEAAFEAAQADHGSLDAYLSRALGVGEAERKRLRALYLQD
jgi:protein-tyrosine phosphatase